MQTKVDIFQNTIRIPAGIISGREGFWDSQTNTKWLAIDGTVKRFDQWPTKIQNETVDAFLQDTESRNYLRKIGITAFSSAFDRWYKCVIGGLDCVPDFNNKNQVVPDAFINTCQNMICDDRGKLCGRKLKLKNFEVQTICTLEKGHSLNESAKILCISLPAVKKRVENINIKLGTRNMASMIATSANFGIL